MRRGPGANGDRAGAPRATGGRSVLHPTSCALLADLREDARRAAGDAAVVRDADRLAVLAQRQRALLAGVEVGLAVPVIRVARLDDEVRESGAAGDGVVHLRGLDRAVVEDAEDVAAD